MPERTNVHKLDGWANGSLRSGSESTDSWRETVKAIGKGLLCVQQARDLEK